MFVGVGDLGMDQEQVVVEHHVDFPNCSIQTIVLVDTNQRAELGLQDGRPHGFFGKSRMTNMSWRPVPLGSIRNPRLTIPNVGQLMAGILKEEISAVDFVIERPDLATPLRCNGGS